MKRYLIPILLLLAGNAWGATYYVSPNGSNTSPYNTWAKAANNLSNILSIALKDSNTIYIAPGNYTTALYLNSVKYANMRIIGALGVNPEDESEIVRDNVIIDGGPGNHTYRNLTVDGIDNNVVKNLTLVANGEGATGKQALINGAALSNGIIFTNVSFKNSGTVASDTISLVGGTGYVFNRCIFISFGGNYVYKTGTGTAKFNYCIFRSKGSGHPINGVYENGTGITTLNNCIITNTTTYAVRLGAAGIVNIYNCFISGAVATHNENPVYNSIGTLNVYNSYITPNPNTLKGYITGADTDSNNIKGGNPKITSYGRVGYIIPCVDDSWGLAYVQGLEQLLSARGMKGTWYIEQASWNTANNTAAQTLVTNGTIEIGLHSYSHNPTNATTLGTITYSGGGANPKYVVNLTGHQFCLQTDSVDSHCQTLSVANDNSFDSILSAIRAASGNVWNITYSTFSGNSTNGDMKISSLSEVGATAITTPVALNVSDTDLSDASSGYYADEIKAPKTWMEGNLFSGITDMQTGAAYVVNSMANPYDVSATNYDTGARTVGLLSLRGNGASGYATLANQNMYNLRTIGATVLIGSDVADTKNRVRALATTAAENGLIVFLLGHNDSEISTTDVNGWGAILDALEEFMDIGAIKVTSAQLASKELRTSPWSYTESTGQISRTYTTFSNYTLLPGSPLIDTGSNVGLTSDFVGNQVPLGSAPDIGAYEFAGDIPLPAAPTNLSATPVSYSQINLSWTDQSNDETGFQIERKTGADETYSQIGTVAANATTYSDSGLAERATYSYRVRAVNGAGNSPYSNEQSATTPSSGTTGGANSGGGGGCSISPEGKSKAESPLATMLALFLPGILLVVRKTIHRKLVLLVIPVDSRPKSG